MLTDDFDEMVLSIGLCVFLVAALLCVYVANKTLAPIARNVEKQKRFVSDAAHELRNPLAAMHARIESVLRTPSPHIEKEVLSDVLSETKRLITLSEYLLAFEQNERTGAGSERTLLKKHIETISRLLEPATKDKRITVHIDVENIYVTLSAPDLETVLYNLLHNSVKFTPNGGTITLTQRGNTLTIADSGIGIRKENIPYLFDRFYKGDASRTTDGSGLGLSLVSEILRRYAATIAVESVVGKGTVFTIVFA
jgi:signal transduction histidine kinase